jgi:hypothetical protein
MENSDSTSSCNGKPGAGCEELEPGRPLVLDDNDGTGGASSELNDGHWFIGLAVMGVAPREALGSGSLLKVPIWSLRRSAVESPPVYECGRSREVFSSLRTVAFGGVNAAATCRRTVTGDEESPRDGVVELGAVVPAPALILACDGVWGLTLGEESSLSWAI